MQATPPGEEGSEVDNEREGGVVETSFPKSWPWTGSQEKEPARESLPCCPVCRPPPAFTVPFSFMFFRTLTAGVMCLSHVCKPFLSAET